MADGLDEAFHDEMDGILVEGVRHYGAQDQATERSVHGDDFEGGSDADFDMDIGGCGAGAARCQR